MNRYAHFYNTSLFNQKMSIIIMIIIRYSHNKSYRWKMRKKSHKTKRKVRGICTIINLHFIRYCMFRLPIFPAYYIVLTYLSRLLRSVLRSMTTFRLMFQREEDTFLWVCSTWRHSLRLLVQVGLSRQLKIPQRSYRELSHQVEMHPVKNENW